MDMYIYIYIYISGHLNLTDRRLPNRRSVTEFPRLQEVHPVCNQENLILAVFPVRPSRRGISVTRELPTKGRP